MLKKIRSFYWLTKAFLSRHYKTIFLMTIIGSLLILLATTYFRYRPEPLSVSRIGRIGKYTISSIPQDIKSKISYGLVEINADGSLAPRLAESWSISEDGMTYAFTINQSARWHSGDPVLPQDLSYAFQEISQEFSQDKVIFHLTDPFSPLPSVLSAPIIKDETIGLGDYQVTDYKQAGGTLQSLTLSSSNEKIIYKFYPTESTAFLAFQLGEIDAIEDITHITEDMRDLNIAVEEMTSNPRIAVLFLNNNDNLLAGKSIRQSLAYAIKDKSFGRTRALTPIIKSSWAYSSNVKEYTYDASRAKSLLTQDVENTGDVHIEIKTMLRYLDVAEQIAADWRETLGITVDVRVTTNITDDYQALLVDYAPPKDPDQYTIWHSTQPSNITNYQNLKIDKLLEDGRRTQDLDLRTQVYQDFQRFLLEDSPAIFLFDTTSYRLSRKGLSSN